MFESLFRHAGKLLAPLAFAAIFVAAGAAQGQPAASGFPACPDAAAPPAEINTPCLAIVDFEDSVLPGNRVAIIRGAGAVMRFGLRTMNAAAAMVPNVDAWWALALDPSVTRLYPDLPMHAVAPPGGCTPWPDCNNGGGDPAPAQTLGEGVVRIGADAVWADVTGNGVGVAIVDTGLDGGHADLAAHIVGGGNCLVAADCLSDNWQDDNGHGTHVGGIVGALDNDIDVVGVAPGASLYAVKVLDASGSGTLSTVMAGLEWVVTQTTVTDPGSIRVANLSLGGPGNCATDAPAMQGAIDNAVKAGVSVVVAAGNDRNLEISGQIPAGCARVIAVASTTAEDGQNSCKRLPAGIPADVASFFTSDGPGVTVSAPGEAREDNNCATIKPVGILSLALGGGTTRLYGTSMAAPHVTGVVALMHEANDGLSPADTAIILGSTADRIKVAPIDHPYVSQTFDGIREGIVDAQAAVAAVPQP